MIKRAYVGYNFNRTRKRYLLVAGEVLAVEGADRSDGSRWTEAELLRYAKKINNEHIY